MYSLLFYSTLLICFVVFHYLILCVYQSMERGWPRWPPYIRIWEREGILFLTDLLSLMLSLCRHSSLQPLPPCFCLLHSLFFFGPKKIMARVGSFLVSSLSHTSGRGVFLQGAVYAELHCTTHFFYLSNSLHFMIIIFTIFTLIKHTKIYETIRKYTKIGSIQYNRIILRFHPSEGQHGVFFPPRTTDPFHRSACRSLFL